MNLWRSPLLVQLTLFVFVVMLLCNPVYAEQSFINYFSDVQTDKDIFPIAYIDESDVDQLIWELQRQGYVIRAGTLAELDQLSRTRVSEVALNQSADRRVEDRKEQECAQEQLSRQPSQRPPNQSSNQRDSNQAPGGNNKAGNGDTADKTCGNDNAKRKPVPKPQDQNNTTEPEPAPESDTSQDTAPPPPAAQTHAAVGVHADVSYAPQGHSGDAAKVFFLVVGVVVVAAFIVYAGKYIADIVRGEDYRLWWEIIFNSTFLSTDAGQHGDFYGAKIATGFVSNELFQLALVGEVGNVDIDLILNRYTNPQPLNISTNYWMLGGAARLHLTDTLINGSYLYLEFMGGTTGESITGTISTARFGASFGIGDTLRLGASYGAQYIGLNEDEGFTNDDDNYWFTLGVEIGARF